LKVGDSIQPIDEVPFLNITRIALNPPIYLFRNVLCRGEDRKSVMDACQQMGMKPAETKSGVVSAHRSHAHVAWLSATVHSVAELMTHLNRELFINNGDVYSEDVQVVRYDSGGRFDLHHDGFDRIVTVIHYLNGVGGTWFPFCKIDEIANDDDDEEPPPRMTMMNPNAMTFGKHPGSDGVWIVGSENSHQPASRHAIPINPGDAIAFYNYEETHVDGLTRAVMNWRSLHAGMPTNQVKWIATNWFRALLEEEEEDQ
jgi:hypothetical protein